MRIPQFRVYIDSILWTVYLHGANSHQNLKEVKVPPDTQDMCEGHVIRTSDLSQKYIQCFLTNNRRKSVSRKIRY